MNIPETEMTKQRFDSMVTGDRLSAQNSMVVKFSYNNPPHNQYGCFIEGVEHVITVRG